MNRPAPNAPDDDDLPHRRGTCDDCDRYRLGRIQDHWKREARR